MDDKLKIVISKKQLRLIPDLSINPDTQPGDRENEFDVEVINNSRQFASFQVELKAIGIDSTELEEWYRVNPELCAKKPPGDRTEFRVAITKTPLSSYGTSIDIKVRAFSVEYPDLYAEEKVNLRIDEPRRSVKLYLPVGNFRVFPGDVFEIPILTINLSPKQLDLEVKIFGLDPSWLDSSNNKLEMRLQPGNSLEKSFLCQIPEDIQIPSQEHNFIIEAKAINSGYAPPVQRGVVEILPFGTIAFYCDKPIRTIPHKFGLIPKKEFNYATFELEFENKSNKIQEISLDVPQREQRKYALELPEPIEVESNETEWIDLVARKKRPWLGGERRFLFKVDPILNNETHHSEESSKRVNIYPNTKLLDLRVRPIIPVLAQILGAIAFVVAIWLWWLLNPPSHRGPVNSVRIIGNVGTVVSGSSDRTIRRWQINSDSWSLLNRLFSRRLRYEGVIAEDTAKAVRVISPSPRDEDLIVAGLSNGDIRFSNILSKTRLRLYQSNDRVFDLNFTNDSRYLFSVHGSGFINQWDIRSQRETPIRQAYPNFAISAVAISESKNQPTLVMAAGRYGKLVIWDWEAQKLYEIEYKLAQSQSGNFDIVGGQNHYIDSLSISNEKNLLAMADNKGYITLWDVEKMRQCINNYERTENNSSNVSQSGQIVRSINLECNNAITEQWSNGHQGSPVRSVSLTQEGCYLASAGDDGRVKLWALQEEGKRTIKEGKILAHYPNIKLNTVDAESREDLILVASDAKKFRVSLYRETKMDVNADCDR